MKSLTTRIEDKSRSYELKRHVFYRLDHPAFDMLSVVPGNNHNTTQCNLSRRSSIQVFSLLTHLTSSSHQTNVIGIQN